MAAVPIPEWVWVGTRVPVHVGMCPWAGRDSREVAAVPSRAFQKLLLRKEILGFIPLLHLSIISALKIIIIK